jgi:predicted RNA polymerase sigma factor
VCLWAAGIRWDTGSATCLGEVLAAIYLMFNEGCLPNGGDCAESRDLVEAEVAP